jgi:peptide/nickel transport system substrate-binding protein
LLTLLVAFAALVLWPLALNKKTAPGAGAKPLVLGMMFEPVSFNPLRGVDSGSYYAASLVYEGLVKYDQNMELTPALAQSFDISADGLVYKFRLRPGLRYSDGEAVTAGDVKASLELAASKISPFRSDYNDIKGISTAGDTITVTLNQRCQPFLSRMAELRILPLSVTAQPDHGNKLLSRTPIGTGAYRLKRWETGLELVFERNPYYWGRAAQSETIVWRIIPDKTVAAVALNKGEIDVAQVDGRMWQNFLAENKRLKVDQFNGNRTVYLGFNLRKNPFSELPVRQALARAIDRDTLSKVFYGGFAHVADTDTPRASWVYTADTEKQNFAPGSVKAGGVTPLLEQARFVRGAGDKYWHRDGKVLAMRILTVKDLEDCADIVSDDLVRAGIKSEVEVIEYSTLRRMFLQKGRFDAVLWSRSCGPDPESTIVWSSKGPLNFCGLKSERVDALLQAGRLAESRADRKHCYGELQRVLAHELPWVFLVQPKLLVAHSGQIDGVQKGRQAELGLPWDNPTINAADWQRR